METKRFASVTSTRLPTLSWKRDARHRKASSMPPALTRSITCAAGNQGRVGVGEWAGGQLWVGGQQQGTNWSPPLPTTRLTRGGMPPHTYTPPVARERSAMCPASAPTMDKNMSSASTAATQQAHVRPCLAAKRIPSQDARKWTGTCPAPALHSAAERSWAIATQLRSNRQRANYTSTTTKLHQPPHLPRGLTCPARLP